MHSVIGFIVLVFKAVDRLWSTETPVRNSLSVIKLMSIMTDVSWLQQQQGQPVGVENNNGEIRLRFAKFLIKNQMTSEYALSCSCSSFDIMTMISEMPPFLNIRIMAYLNCTAGFVA